MPRRLRSKAAAAILAASLAASHAHASAAQPPLLTLAEAQRIAVGNHPTIRGQNDLIAAATEGVKIARADFAPQVYGEAVQALAPPGTRISAYNGITDPTILQRTAVGVGITQYVTDFGRTADQVRAAEADLAAQARQGDVSNEIVLLNVTQAYYEVLRARALAVVAVQTQSSRRTLLRQAQALQRAGLRSLLDVSTAARDLASADQLVLESRERVSDALATLADAMGTPNVANYRLESEPKVPELPPSADRMIATALQQNPQIEELAAESEAARQRAAAAGKLTDPTVEGYGFVGATPIRDNVEAIKGSYTTIGVNLTVPVFTGGALQAERRQAADEAGAAQQREFAARNDVSRDLRVAYDSVRAAQGNIAVSAQLLKTANEALRLTRARYQIGLNSIVDLSDAQLQQTEAAIAETNARYDYIVRESSLEFAAGTLAVGAP